ncbi:MAG TPA: protein kinase, partial [Verrucomicrobiales bacterium]|nr:protein kinase [Verrucomicrobiales bacterium]
MSTPTISGYAFDTCRGSGAFGSVWKALWNGDFECAVKVLTPGAWHPRYLSWCLERLRREGERLDFVRIYSYDLTSQPPSLSMALLPEGTLSLEQLAGRLPAREAWTLLDSLAGTLAWLHTEGIVHTGLTGGNVFVCSGPAGEPAVLLSDVGQGWLTEAPVARLHGQLGFIAPEHWRSATRLLQEGRALGRDVYAFGVIAWRLLTGTWPRGQKVFDAIKANGEEDLNLQPSSFADWLEKEPSAAWPAGEIPSEEAARRKIVEQCLAIDPAARFSDMKAVLEALKPCALPVAAAPAADETAVLEGATAADAFAPDTPPAPKRRRFSLPLPRLSRRLQENRGESPPVRRSILGPALTMFALLGVAGATAYAFKERNTRKNAEGDLKATRHSLDDLQARLPRSETEAVNARSEAQAAKAEQAAALRQSSVELIGKVLATEPLEDSDIPGWRTAVRAVAVQCTGVLENAPDDATGMEARWQLARLKNALADDAGALPVLEKLSRDLEANAIAAAGNFPAELIRLSGRVESLIGRILTSQHRTENALPHLRKASDFFEKWVKDNADDIDSVRSYAQNLFLEGHALAERGQPEPARDALMKIEGFIGKPEDANFRPEDRFLLADAHLELGRINAAEAGKQVSSDPAGKEKSKQLLETAVDTQYETGIKLLLAYDKTNPKSIPCRTRLAGGYSELGHLFVRLENPRDASVAFGESVKLYTELMKEMPDNAGYITSLATVYNDFAELKHSNTPGAAGARDALSYQNYS